MTTTAHEDQYLATPEPVRQPYDTVAILRRNIADLEVALRAQTERAEAAEAELARMAQQKPVAWMDAEGDTYKEEPPENWCPPYVPLYASFAHAMHKGATHCDDCGLTWLDDGLNPLGCPYCKDTVPAPAVPAEWREFVESVPDYLSNYRDKHDHYGPVLLKEQARALLQSAPQAPAVPVPAEWRDAMTASLNALESMLAAVRGSLKYPQTVAAAEAEIARIHTTKEVVIAAIYKARALLQSAEVTK